jgi:hypothetical protein
LYSNLKNKVLSAFLESSTPTKVQLFPSPLHKTKCTAFQIKLLLWQPNIPFQQNSTSTIFFGITN